MLKNILLAATFALTASPAFVSAQDFFFSFDEFSRVPTTTLSAGTATGSLFIFADENLDFNEADIDFSNSDASVIAFTNATAFNTDGTFGSVSVSDPNGNLQSSPTATDGRLFVFSGIFPGQLPSFQGADFRAGANGFLLAQVDFDVVGEGTANFDFTVGLGVVNTAFPPIDPTFGTASVTVEAQTVPEPSSVILSILGTAAMITRRRRPSLHG